MIPASPSVVPSVMRYWPVELSSPVALDEAVLEAWREEERVALGFGAGAVGGGFPGRLFFLITRESKCALPRLKNGLTNSHSSDSFGLSAFNTPVCGCGTLSAHTSARVEGECEGEGLTESIHVELSDKA